MIQQRKLNSTNFFTKYRLYKSLVVSILHYGCEPGRYSPKQNERSKPSSTSACADCCASHTWSTRRTSTCGTQQRHSWDPRNPSWQLSSDASLSGSVTSPGTTPCARLYFRELWRVVVAVADRERAGQTMSRNGPRFPWMSCSQRPRTDPNGGGLLSRRPSCPPDGQIGQGNEMKNE